MVHLPLPGDDNRPVSLSSQVLDISHASHRPELSVAQSPAPAADQVFRSLAQEWDATDLAAWDLNDLLQSNTDAAVEADAVRAATDAVFGGDE